MDLNSEGENGLLLFVDMKKLEDIAVKGVEGDVKLHRT